MDEKHCSAGDCTRDVEARDLCHAHLQRLLRTGDVQPDVPLRKKVRRPARTGEGDPAARSPRALPDAELSAGRPRCSVDGCGRAVRAKGLCGAHHHRLVATGDVRAEEPIRETGLPGWLSHGYQVVSVTESDRPLAGDARSMGEHRLVMARSLGRALWPDESVHHRNGDRLDNRLGNLELWSRWQPSGQRVEDKVAWAAKILRRYAPELLCRPDGPK